MLSVLQFSIFLVSSFIEDFFHLFISFFISFQQKNEIKKGNTLMEFIWVDYFKVDYSKIICKKENGGHGFACLLVG